MIARTRTLVLEAAGAPRALYVTIATVIALIVVGISLTPPMAGFLQRVLLFYAATTLAYGAMPYVRRGDIPFVAMWVVLGAELAPSVVGQMISPIRVTADVCGVAMAVAPIDVARLRQVKQGDTRRPCRRATEIRES